MRLPKLGQGVVGRFVVPQAALSLHLVALGEAQRLELPLPLRTGFLVSIHHAAAQKLVAAPWIFRLIAPLRESVSKTASATPPLPAEFEFDFYDYNGGLHAVRTRRLGA